MTDPQSGPVTVDEPERTNNPAEIGSLEVPSERGGARWWRSDQ